jgi:NADPH:quinone reductase-like Zn-dependent oxidoreductase
VKAIVRDRYGLDALELREIESPEVTEDRVLVRVHASSVNPVDWYDASGRPSLFRAMSGLRRPKVHTVGSDFAGVIESTGEEVYGVANGAFGEYVAARRDRIAPKPAGLTFDQAAAVPVAAVTALQALRDKGGVQAGQRVLINGASGGVGTFAIQLAKSFGAEVTGVCSTQKVEQTRTLGADHVADYTREDFTRSDRRYDLMIDIAGSRSFTDCRRVLAPDATFVCVGGSKANRLLGPLPHMIGSGLKAIGKSQKVVTFFVASITPDDLNVLTELMEAGKVTPVVERRYELAETVEALRYLGEGHARGKIVIAI